MGTDIYHVNMERHRRLTREEALMAALAYGFHPRQPPAVLRAHPGPFLEITLSLRSVYYDAPVCWDALMLLRLADEAVYRSARKDGSGYDFERTPLSERHAGFWSMGMPEGPSIHEDVSLVQVEHTPPPSPPGPRRDWTDDWARVVFLLPEFLAPNIAAMGFWESRAWGGSSYGAERELRDLAPWQAEVRPVQPTHVILQSAPDDRGWRDTAFYPALAPRAAGGLWVVMRSDVFTLDPQTGTLRWVARLPEPAKWSWATRALEDADGTLWVGLTKGLARYRADTGPELDPVVPAGKQVHQLALAPDGRLVVAGVGGIWSREAGGAWTQLREGLLDTTVESLAITEDGTIWAGGTKGLTRRAPDGTMERLQKTQGVGANARVVALPGGAVFVSSDQSAGLLRPGSGRVEPHPGVQGALPTGFSSATWGADGALWAIKPRDILVQLREGEPARAFALPDLLDTPSTLNLVALPSGELWVGTDRALYGYSAEDLGRALASPPLRAGPVAPIRFRLAERRARGVDFSGRTVCLTGTLSRLSRDEASALLRQRGATVVSSVSAKTDYLIAGAGAGSKATKAAKLGVTVLDEEALTAPPGEPGGEEAPSDALLAARFPRWRRDERDPGTLDLPLMRSLLEGSEPVSPEDWAVRVARHQEFLARGGAGNRWENLSTSGLLIALYPYVDAELGALQLSLTRQRLTAGILATGAQLQSANLAGAMAEGIDLSGADLRRSNLVGAFLAGAKLRGADLRSADLSSADLRGARREAARRRPARRRPVQRRPARRRPAGRDAERRRLRARGSERRGPARRRHHPGGLPGRGAGRGQDLRPRPAPGWRWRGRPTATAPRSTTRRTRGSPPRTQASC